jgi:hypothetical protein
MMEPANTETKKLMCMKVTRIAIMAHVLALLSQTVYAQNDTFTQVGTWSCVVPSTASLPFACPRVNFPTEFGGTPDVVITPEQVKIQNVTPQGFTPVSLVKAPPLPLPVPVPVNLPLSGIWIAIGPRLYEGTATATYMVLTVIYAPPGSNGGKGQNSVSYGSGVTTGTTTSASQSFQNAIGVSVSDTVGDEKIGPSAAGSLSYDYSNTGTNTQSYDIKQTTSYTLTRPGPGADGINHDEDAIYLLLKPALNLALSSSSAVWTFGDNSHSIIQYVLVGELNGDYQWRPGVLAQLSAAGITSADYCAILASDPLATSSAVDCPAVPVLDPQRFADCDAIYPYEGPPNANDPVIPIQTTISSSVTSTVGSAQQNTQKVGLSLSGSTGFLGIGKVTFTNTNSWTWTNSSSTSTTTANTQTASLTIGGPAYGYNGVTAVAVYRDTVYNTFAFVFVPPSSLEVAVKGTIKTAAGTSLMPPEEVTLIEKGITHHTVTNPKGEYAFYGNITGPVTIQAAGKTEKVPQSREPRPAVDFVVP